MNRPFRAEGGQVTVQLGADERALLARLLDEVGELLDDGSSLSGEGMDPLAAIVGFDPRVPEVLGDGSGRDRGPAENGAGGRGDAGAADAEAGQDPAVARLLPDAHRDDPVVAAEFRRLTEAGLRTRKRNSLAVASVALRRPAPVVLVRDEACALVKGLTDVRLVLAERLGLRTESDGEEIYELLQHRNPAEDPWIAAALLYDVLTVWQESLVSSLHP